MKKLLLAALALMMGFGLSAKIKLPSFIGNNMVLQRECDAAVWGWTDKANHKVTVAPSWSKKKFKAVADADGKWFLRIPTPEAGGPYTITFSDGDKLTIKNVLIGEVWYCSGQSNMTMPMVGFESQPVEGATDAIMDANPKVKLRMCTITPKTSLQPMDTTKGVWKRNTPAAVSGTSATAYFFGRRLQQVLGIPVGILVSSLGGTPIEGWINRETIEKEFADEFDLSYFDADTLPERPGRKPGLLFNGQVAPLVPYTFKGMIWYQGETNRTMPEQYSRLQPAYVKMMREVFENPDAPFYFVQIAPYAYGKPERFGTGYFNEAQAKTLAEVPNTGMAVTVDIGEYETIHPCKKKEVGDRLAFLALQNTYGIKAIDAVSPSFKSVVFEDGKAIVEMNVDRKGLSPMGRDLTGFELAGEDRVFHPATGRIAPKEKNKVTVSCPEVPNPVAVRYCFRNWSKGTVFNGYGIPAAPFRSDDWDDIKQ